tara:strand:+ start:10034 stop:10282 length:249 start_codon:yes stop_codon:yes gene_type:complete
MEKKKPVRRAARKTNIASPEDAVGKFGHAVLMTLHHNGQVFSPDDEDVVFVDEAEFDALKAAQVFDGEWEDGETGPPAQVTT